MKVKLTESWHGFARVARRDRRLAKAQRLWLRDRTTHGSMIRPSATDVPVLPGVDVGRNFEAVLLGACEYCGRKPGAVVQGVGGRSIGSFDHAHDCQIGVEPTVVHDFGTATTREEVERVIGLPGSEPKLPPPTAA